MEVASISGPQGRVPRHEPASEGAGFKTEAPETESSFSQQQASQPKFQATSIHMDSGAWVAVLQVRDPDTGDVMVQVPSTQALEEYKRNGAEDNKTTASKSSSDGQGVGGDANASANADPAAKAKAAMVEAGAANVAAAVQQTHNAPPTHDASAQAAVKSASNSAASQSVKLVV